VIAENHAAPPAMMRRTRDDDGRLRSGHTLSTRTKPDHHAQVLKVIQTAEHEEPAEQDAT